jgi:hypothetical protein
VSYQSEKFNAARRALMLPHTKGEAASIGNAFLEISLALSSFDESKSGDANIQGWVRRLRELMDTSKLKHGSELGGWQAKAKSFSTEERSEVSRLVDELASWFAEQSRN